MDVIQRSFGNGRILSKRKVMSVLSVVLFGVPLIALQTLPMARVVFYCGMVISSLALFASSCLLLHAAFRGKPKLMWPWIVTAWGTSVPLGLLCIAGMVTVSFRAANFNSAAKESGVISAYFVHSMLLYCCTTVVNSRRVELQRHVHVRKTNDAMEVADSLLNPNRSTRSSNSTHVTLA